MAAEEEALLRTRNDLRVYPDFPLRLSRGSLRFLRPERVWATQKINWIGRPVPVSLNIAEGETENFPAKDRCRYFDIAHGSALECAAGLDVLVAKRRLNREQIRSGKEILLHIVRMLMGLIKKNAGREYMKGSLLTA